MSRRRATAAPVSLFPFLAVLMCTMGALIVLLVLVSAQVRDDAVAKAEQEREQEKPQPVSPEPVESTSPVYDFIKLPPLEPLVELPELAPLPELPDLDAMQARLAALRANEKKLEAQLVERNAWLLQLKSDAGAIEKATALAVAERERLEEEIRRLTEARNSAIQELAELAGERRRLLASIADSRKMIQERQKELKGNAEFQVVSYDGKAGTTRRPIIIECTDNSIEFVSEGIHLSPKQLLGYEPKHNPLLAGANEIVRYWATTHGDPAATPMPYVLLVVRPSGTVGFYLARKFLAGLGADYGYELVEEDLEYAAPPEEPRATEMARAAIAEMLASGPPKRSTASTFSESLADRSSNGSTGRGGSGGSLKGGSGGRNAGLVREPRTFDSREFQRGARNASRGFFSSSHFRNRSQGLPGGNFSGSESSAGRPGQGARSGKTPGTIGSEPAQLSGRKTAQRPDTGMSPTGGTQNSLLPVPQLGTLAGRQNSQALQKPFKFSAEQTPLIGGPSNDQKTEASLPRFEDDPSGENNGTGTSTRGEDSTSAERGRGTSGGDASTGTDLAGAESSLGARHEIAGDSRQVGSPFDAAGKDARQAAEGEETAGEQTANGSPDGPKSSAVSSIDATTHPLLRNRSPSGKSSSGGASGGLPLGLPENNVTIGADEESAPRLSPRSTQSRPRGHRRQWGIRNPSGTIALERPVIVRVSREKVIIGDKFKITRTVDRSNGQVVEWTLIAMDRVAREWGVPPKRFYWVPAVTLVVEDGGELLRGPLHERLRKSGISVETQFGGGTFVREAAQPADSGRIQ